MHNSCNQQQNTHAAQLKNRKQAGHLNRHFPREDTQMANGHVKRCPMSLVTRQVQSETTRHGLTSVRRPPSTHRQVSVGEDEEERGAPCTAGGAARGGSHHGKQYEYSGSPKMTQQSHSPALIRRNEISTSRAYLCPCGHHGAIHNGQDVEAAWAPIGRGRARRTQCAQRDVTQPQGKTSCRV